MYGTKFSNRLSKRSALALMACGLALSFLMALASHSHASWLQQLDDLFNDTVLVDMASQTPVSTATVVDIDEVSLEAVGQWPWPRYRIGALVEAIAAKQPAAIALDILLPEPDRSSIDSIQSTYKHDFNLDLAITGAPAGLRDNDGYLGHILAQSRSVGSEYLYFDRPTKSEVAPSHVLEVTGDTDLLALHEASGILRNTFKISSQTEVAGFINTHPDRDGRLRRLPLLIKYDGLIHASLALAALMRSLDVDSVRIDSDRDGPLLHVGGHAIPIDRYGEALLRLKGKSLLYPSVSAVDVLNGSVPDAALRGKIVFLGSTATGLNDLHNTASDPQFPGLMIQAAMVDGMATDQFIRVPEWLDILNFAECLITGALVSALFIRAERVSLVVLGSAAITTFLLGLALLLFSRGNLLAPPGPALVVVALLFVTFTIYRFAAEKRHAYLWFKKLENARQVTIESMAAVAETRDPETGAHIKRTQHYVRAIADQLRSSGHYTHILTPEYINLLFISAPLHDVGKVGVPDHILLKPGKLDEDELVIMRRHAEFGRSIILNTAQLIEGDNYLAIAGEIAATHHEKWDGTGYPVGLAGQDIPLSGRIMSVADIYDALISRRCYKDPMPHADATRFMQEASGKIFDPVILQAFFQIEGAIMAIAARYRDDSELVLGDR
jgi:adenylate cyclase